MLRDTCCVLRDTARAAPTTRPLLYHEARNTRHAACGTSSAFPHSRAASYNDQRRPGHSWRNRRTPATRLSSGADPTSMTSLSSAIDFYHDLAFSGALAQETWGMLAPGMRERSLYFGDRPLCTVLRPLLHTEDDYRFLVQRTQLILSVFRKASEAMVRDEALRAQVYLTPEEEYLVSLPTGYRTNIPTARLDSLLHAHGRPARAQLHRVQRRKPREHGLQRRAGRALPGDADHAPLPGALPRRARSRRGRHAWRRCCASMPSGAATAATSPVWRLWTGRACPPSASSTS